MAPVAEDCALCAAADPVMLLGSYNWDTVWPWSQTHHGLGDSEPSGHKIGQTPEKFIIKW